MSSLVVVGIPGDIRDGQKPKLDKGAALAFLHWSVGSEVEPH